MYISGCDRAIVGPSAAMDAEVGLFESLDTRPDPASGLGLAKGPSDLWIINSCRQVLFD